MDDPGIDAYDCTAGEGVAVDYCALRGDETFEDETGVGVDAEGFVDDGIAG